jgi:hypothetical protein
MGDLFFFPGVLIRKPNTKRTRGHIAHIGISRTAGFWAVIKTSDAAFFAYGKSFLTYPAVPNVGRNVKFTALPPIEGRGTLGRATEIEILPAMRRTLEKITVVRLPNGVMQIRCGDKTLGELSL